MHKRSLRLRWLVCSLILALITTDRVGADPNNLENIVVTASREPHAATQLPAAINIISADDIRIQRANTLTDVLRQVPGLHIDQPGPRGGRASVYTRGLDPNHTIIMIDGIPLNDETNARGGSFDFSTLTGLDLERVEIIRGPISAVHGSAAMAGAINLIPRRGTETTTASVSGTGGGSGYRRGRASLSGSNGPIDLSIAGTYTDESDPTPFGSFRGGSLFSQLGLQLSDDAELRGTVRFADSRSSGFPDFSGGDQLSVNRELEARDTEELSGALVLAHDLSERLRYSARFNVHRRREIRNTPAVFASPDEGFAAVPGEPETRQRYLRYSLALNGTAELTDDIDLTIGGDAYREDGRSRGEVDFGIPIPGIDANFDIDRIVVAPFTEIFWATPIGINLLAGLRVDLPESRSEEFLPRVGASYTVPHADTTLRASWGRGFKLPSFFALASPLAGNRNLRPERSKGFDLTVEQPLFDNRVDVRLSYFNIDVAGLIDFNPETLRLENLASVDSRGGELELAAHPHPALGLRAHATYTDVTGVSIDAPGRRRLRNRPRWRGGFTATWSPLPVIDASLRALFVGDTADASAPTGEEQIRLSGYHRLDLALSWQPIEKLSIFLAVDNLTDSEYEELIGFTAVGIRPRAGIEIQL